MEKGADLGGHSFMAPCGNFTGQAWRFIPLADRGYYQLTTYCQEEEGLCLESAFYDHQGGEGGCQFVTGPRWIFQPGA